MYVVDRVEYTVDDRDNLAKFLLNYPTALRTTPSTHKEVAQSLGRHSWQSWHSHYKKYKEDIDRRLQLFKRKRYRKRERERERKENRQEGEEDEEDEDEEEDEEEEEDSPQPPVASTSNATTNDQKGKKKKKRSRSSSEEAPRTATLQRTTTSPKKKRRDKFDDEVDWKRLILMLAKGQDQQWQKNQVYAELARKYPSHTAQSWQNWHSKARDDADDALAHYQKERRRERKRRRKAGEPSASEEEDSEPQAESESEPEPEPERPKKKKKKTSTSVSAQPEPTPAPPVASSSKSVADQQTEPRTSTSKSAPVDDAFDEPSSDSDIEIRPVVKTDKKKLPPRPPPPQPSAAPLPTQSKSSRQVSTTSTSSLKDRPTSNPFLQYPKESFTVPDSYRTISRSLLVSSTQAPPARTQQRPPPRQSASNPPRVDSTRTRTQKNPSSTPRPPPPPPPIAPQPPVPTAQTPRTKASAQQIVQKAAAIALPSEGADDFDDLGQEPSTEEEDDMEEEIGGDDDEDDDDGTVDDERLVRELTRSEWFDLSKQHAFETLSTLYPYYSTEEWEQRYVSRRGGFMELITIATERIEEGELYPEDASPEEEEAERIEVIVEELVRCELLGLEKNPIAWETLDQLWPTFGPWQQTFLEYKRSFWQKRVSQEVREIEEERKRRKDKGKRTAKAAAGMQKRKREETREDAVPSDRQAEEQRREEKGKGRAVEQGGDVGSRLPVAQKALDTVSARGTPARVAQSSRPSSSISTSKARTSQLAEADPAPARTQSVTKARLSSLSTSVQAPLSSPFQPRKSQTPRPNLARNRLEPPTPPRIATPRKSAVARPRTPPAAVPVATTPRRSPPKPVAREQSLSASETSLPRHSQYSVIPSPFIGSPAQSEAELAENDTDEEEGEEEEDRSQRDLSGDAKQEEAQTDSEREDDDDERKEQLGEPDARGGEDVGMDVDEEEEKEVAAVRDQAESAAETRTTSRTTSSDRQLLQQLERSVEAKFLENGQEAEEKIASVGRAPGTQQPEIEGPVDEEEESQVPYQDARIDHDETTRDHLQEGPPGEDEEDSFDPDNPFVNYDPAQQIWSPVEDIFGNLRKLEQFRESEEEELGESDARRNRRAGQGARGREVEQSELEKEAEEWTSDDKNAVKPSSEVVAKVKGTVRRVQANPLIVAEPGPGGNERKRARSEDENAIEGKGKEEEQGERRPVKKARPPVPVGARSSSSMSSEDVGKWRKEVQPGPTPSSVATPIPRVSSPRRIPRAALALASPKPAPSPVPSTTNLSPLPVAPPTVPPRQVHKSRSDKLRDELSKIAQDLSVPFSLVDGAYFCFCAPIKLGVFAKYARFYSPTLRPDPSSAEYEQLAKAIRKHEWTYDEDRAVLAGTEQEKAAVAAIKGEQAIGIRLLFLEKTRKDAVERLPRSKYERNI
ncbi:hypothetical protein JCM16303_006713 [Sporobolomyces ruberrimus]